MNELPIGYHINEHLRFEEIMKPHSVEKTNQTPTN